MSRLFESFERLDRRWEDRALEGRSLPTAFVWLLLVVFIGINLRPITL